MNPQAAQTYLRSKVFTATAEQLQLMLFDGAIRFAEQGKAALQKSDYQTSHRCLTRAQEIINELTGNLRRDVFPDLCEKLAALYNYAHRNLVQANVKHDAALVDESLKVLKFQRETWAMLLEQLGKTKAAEATKRHEPPDHELRAEATISMQG